MSLLIKGELQSDWMAHETENGEFVRMDSQFRNWITKDGRPGPSGEGGFPAEAGRYHLYISHACPWAHRTMIFRALRGLESAISYSVVHPYMGPNGWSFDRYPGAEGDALHDADYLYRLYVRAQPDYSGIVTVPVLWDKQRETIVNNESSEIIRMLNASFSALAKPGTDYYPAELRSIIDAINAEVYDNVNNGVYRAGFAESQAAYERAFMGLFGTLDRLEARLRDQPWLAGDHLTEADWRLFTTLVRFDAVYYVHFKCNKRRLVDYPELWDFTRALYQAPGIADTVNMDHIKRHYYTSHPELNPRGLIPGGPDLDFGAATRRRVIAG
ncbi:glutathione S-transferase family protein [Acidihalobacter prosperus]|uniref:Glutathione S-transferase n=1 Tax=Acidihalobacter prosperus TaxID=160660 RepID=A0A1A6C6R2_9GAMM|nr:glutathione S-transferase family protein [Acidihalobacter prosperus]OBS10248.1 Glutathione S-transferase [Acidihalobacter prosperus]